MNAAQIKSECDAVMKKIGAACGKSFELVRVYPDVFEIRIAGSCKFIGSLAECDQMIAGMAIVTEIFEEKT